MATEAAQKIAALTKAVSIFDQDCPPTVAQLQGVFKALGQDVPAAKCEYMIEYVTEEHARNSKDLLLEDGFQHSYELPQDGEGTKPRSMTEMKGVDINVCKDTIAGVLEESFKKFGDKPWMGTREGAEYKFQTFSECQARIKAFGSGIRKLCGLKKGSHIGINLKTQQRWLLAHYANAMFGMVTVTLYDTLGEQAVEYILDQAALTTIITNNANCEKMVANAEKYPLLKFIIVVGELTPDLVSKGEAKGVTIFSFDHVEAEGGNQLETPESPQPSDRLLICYTSGTTGLPKGVCHTQSSLAAGCTTNYLNSMPGDVHLSFLPLAHIMELYLQNYFMTYGIASGFYSGDTTKLLEDAAVLKPTLFVGVPRLLNKIHDKVMAGIRAAEGIKKVLTDLAVASKKKGLEKGFYRSYWDFIVFDKVKAVLGGRVRFIATGSAPISPEVLSFYRVFFGAAVMEGYGMSEACPTHFTNILDIKGVGTVGPPVGMNATKLMDVPDMNYFTTDNPPRGEICFKGAVVMEGYYKDPEKTKEAITADGWMRSGDIGQWMPNGTLKIIDRKKNIFKLSQGEYVAPEKCENIFAQCPFVAQSFTYGDSLKSELVTIVVPDPDVLLPWAKKAGHGDDFAALCSKPEVNAAILADLDKTARAKGLKGFEVPKAIFLECSPFSPDNGLLTPTSKLKRNTLREHYKQAIDEMYSQRADALAAKMKAAAI